MTSKIDPKLLDKNVTLKSTVKRKRKNKKTNLQELYDAGLVRSEAFYKELITFIKWRLMPDLIKKGYYIDGIRQSNFTSTISSELLILHSIATKSNIRTSIHGKILKAEHGISQLQVKSRSMRITTIKLVPHSRAEVFERNPNSNTGVNQSIGSSDKAFAIQKGRTAYTS